MAPRTLTVQADLIDGVAYFVVPEFKEFKALKLYVRSKLGGTAVMDVSQTQTMDGELVLEPPMQRRQEELGAGTVEVIELKPPMVSQRYRAGEEVALKVKKTEGVNGAEFKVTKVVFEYAD